MRAEAAQCERLEIEVSERCVNGVDVVFKRDEFDRFVVEVRAVVVEGSGEKKVVDMFGRNIKKHVVVSEIVSDSCDESDRQVR